MYILSASWTEYHLETMAGGNKTLLKIVKETFPDPLSPSEKTLLPDVVAPPCKRKTLPNDTTRKVKMRAELLRHLCINHKVKKFIGLRGIELRNVRIMGPLCLDSAKVKFPLGFYDCSFESISLIDAKTRTLSFVHCTCGSLDAAGIETRGGISIQRSTIKKTANLRCATVGGDLVLKGTHIGKQTNELAESNGNGFCRSALELDDANIDGNVYLSDGFRAKGEVSLTGMATRGDLDCRRGKFHNPCDTTGEGIKKYAIYANLVKIDGRVCLKNGFRADGQVLFLEAQVRGDFDCAGGYFFHGSGNGHAISLDRSHVLGSAFFCRGFESLGEIRLLGTYIEGDLICTAGTFLCASARINNRSVAINALQTKIGGSVLLRKKEMGEYPEGRTSPNETQITTNRFHTNGMIILDAACIGSDVTVDGAQFAKSPYGPNGVQARKAKIGNAFYWKDIKKNEDTWLDLQYAETRHLDFADHNSWPRAGNLNLDGCVYTSFKKPDARRSAIRLLERQDEQSYKSMPASENPGEDDNDLVSLTRKQGKSFNPQPYEQLASVLIRNGDESEARRVLSAKAVAKHRHGKRTLKQKRPCCYWMVLPFWEIIHQLYKWTVGFGYRPYLALGWAAAIFIAGVAIYWVGYDKVLVVPTEAEACKLFVKTSIPATAGTSRKTAQPTPRSQISAQGEKPEVPAYHPEFNAFLYMLDVFVPGVDLYQEKSWRPAHIAPYDLDIEKIGDFCLAKQTDSKAETGLFESVVTYYAPIAVFLGWIFIALALLGPKGFLRKT